MSHTREYTVNDPLQPKDQQYYQMPYLRIDDYLYFDDFSITCRSKYMRPAYRELQEGID